MIRVIMCTMVSEWNLIPYLWKCVMDNALWNESEYIFIYVYAHVVIHVKRCESSMNYGICVIDMTIGV